MVGLLAQIFLCWLLLKLIEKKDLSVLGWRPSAQRLQELLFGLIITAICCTGYHLLRSYANDIHWQQNPNFKLRDLANGMWYMFRSVLYEELIFRGALFYIAIQRLGSTKAVILSSICFGIYHWFSYEAWGQPIYMIYIFLITTAAGWMFAYSFLKTNSLYLPIGLHFGWNAISSFLFSQGNIGSYILIPIEKHIPNNSSLLFFIILIIYQIIVAPLVTWLYLRKKNRNSSQMTVDG